MTRSGRPLRTPQARAWQAGLPQHPLADARDQPGLLGQPQELARLDHAALGVVPADQRLEADDLAAAQVDLRLVEEPELALLDGPLEVGLGARAGAHAAAHAVVEHLVGDALALRAVHRLVGVADQLARRPARARR